MTDDDRHLVLLVEDQAIIALAEAEVLRRRGYRVDTALTGEEAVEKAVQNERIDLVLMDINLGAGLDGTEAAERILASRALPIVFLTAYSDEQTVARVRNITRYGYVVKNSGDSVLISSIEMALELFAAHQRAAHGERRLQRAQHLAMIGSYERDAESGETIGSPEIYEILGDPKARLDREGFLDHVLDADRERVSREADRVRAANEGRFDLEYRIVRHDGAVRWVHDRAEHWRDATGRHRSTFGILQDITERRLVTDELRARGEELDLALAAGRVVVWAYDPESRSIEYREPARDDRLSDFPFVQSLDELWAVVDEADRGALTELVNAILHGSRESFALGYRVRNESGEWRSIMTRGLASTDRHGRRIVRGASVDVTDQTGPASESRSGT